MSDDFGGLFIGEHRYCIAGEFPTKSNGKTRRPCGSSDALSVYEHEGRDGKIWYDATCFSCRQKFTREEVHKSSIAESLGIDTSTCEVSQRVNFEHKASKKARITREELSDLWVRTGSKEGNSGKGYRGLEDWVLKFYGHRLEYDKEGNVEYVYYPETKDYKIHGYKSRYVPEKKFGYRNLGQTGVSNQLSGQYKFPDGGKYALVVGGEEDKVAAQQMLRAYQKLKNQDGYAPYAVVSPTTGEPSAPKQCKQQYDWFEQFDIIVVGMDNDEAGNEATEEICQVLPKEKVRIAKWTGKDPNQMLLDGQMKQFWSDFFGAKELVDSGITSSVNLRSKIKQALRRPRLSLPPSMAGLQECTKGDGLIKGRIYSIIGDTSVGKCEDPETPVLMSDTSVKKIKDIKVGEFVMGADGSPREVLGVHTGRDTMYRIDQVDGDSYTVNSKHVLSLRAGYTIDKKCSVRLQQGKVYNVPVEDYIKYPKKAQRSLKGYKGHLTKLDNGVRLKHPWLLGMWLGDGHYDQATITQAHSAVECIDEMLRIADEYGYGVKTPPSGDRLTTKSYRFSNGLRTYLNSFGLIKNKHIPIEWKTACYEDRLQLLAGLIDSDGHLHNRRGYDIIQKSKALSEDIVFLAKSLGFKCSIKPCHKYAQTGGGGLYYRMYISGKLYKLSPYLQLEYKKTQESDFSKLRELHNTEITVTEVGEGEYVGIQLDGDSLYCHGDFTVTHNSTFINTMAYHWFFQPTCKVGVVSLEATDGEYGVDILSLHLSTNLYWVDPDKVDEYLDEPEVIKLTENLLVNEYGESRFEILDDREGTVNSLEKKIEQLYRQYDCDVIIVDVTTDLLRVLTNEQQAAHFNWQSNFVKNGVTIFNVLHTRKPPANRDGTPKKPTEYDTLGSSIFVQKAAGNFVIYRNKSVRNDPIEQNSTYFDVPKMRQGSTGDKFYIAYYDPETRKVYDRDKFFKDNPDKLPAGYDLSVSSFDKAYYEEGGRGWDGVSKKSSGFTKKASPKEEPLDDFDIKLDGGVVL